MIAIGMPAGFEWFFLLVVLGVPITLAFFVVFLVVRSGRRTARGFTVTPNPPGDPTLPR